jgi:hypothetical protein
MRATTWSRSGGKAGDTPAHVWEKRKQQKAQAAARRDEFLAAVGGLDLLAHTIAPQLEHRAGAEGAATAKIFQRQARQLAEMLLGRWVAGDAETDGRTPQEFVDEQLGVFLARVDSLPLVTVARRLSARKTPRE